LFFHCGECGFFSGSQEGEKKIIPKGETQKAIAPLSTYFVKNPFIKLKFSISLPTRSKAGLITY
jgi:hypothetical protein